MAKPEQNKQDAKINMRDIFPKKKAEGEEINKPHPAPTAPISVLDFCFARLSSCSMS